MSLRRLAGFVLPLSLAAACSGPPATEQAAAPAAPPSPPELVQAAPPKAAQAAEVIDEEFLRSSVAELASDEYAGRGPGTDGGEKARAYLADRLQALGLQPGGPDGSWQQPFDIVGITTEEVPTWTFHSGSAEKSLDWWDDFMAFSGVQQPEARLDDAELVFAGYGIEAPEYDWDDFKGADLTGKVLVIMNNDPDWDPQLFEGERRLYYGRWDYKYEEAAAQGAAGAIIIHTTASAGYPWQVVQTSWSGEQSELPAGEEARLQVKGWTTLEASRELVALGGHDLDQLMESAKSRDFQPVPLGITTSIALHNSIRRFQTANVLGVLLGGDPQKAQEVVIYTAHHDHLGVGRPDDTGDTIYNGALDNGAGVAQVLAIARAFTALPQPPKRSVLFAFVAAEEQGLLGSQYYAEHPTFLPGRLAADINYDGGNIWGRSRDITYIGYGKSSLDRIVEHYAGTQGRTVKPDQFPDRGFFYRSDQFSLAKIGVPAIYLDTGTDFIGRPEGWGRQQIEAWEEHHYHQPSDELTDDWTFEGMIEDARLGFWCGLEVADQDSMPSWNPDDEFADERQAALAALETDS